MYACTVYKEIFAFILFSTSLPSMSANWANFNVSNNLFFKHNYIEQNRSHMRKSENITGRKYPSIQNIVKQKIIIAQFFRIRKLTVHAHIKDLLLFDHTLSRNKAELRRQSVWFNQTIISAPQKHSYFMLVYHLIDRLLATSSI